KREDFRAGVQMRIVMPRLSVRVTRWVMAHTRLRPNEITVISLVVGLSAAAAFAATNPGSVLAGFCAYHVHVLLDYVDGEVARCRGETSVQGAYLDLMTDRLTFPLLVFCSGVGVYREIGSPAALIVAFVAAFGLTLDKEACDCWYRARAGSLRLAPVARPAVAPRGDAARAHGVPHLHDHRRLPRRTRAALARGPRLVARARPLGLRAAHAARRARPFPPDLQPGRHPAPSGAALRCP